MRRARIILAIAIVVTCYFAVRYFTRSERYRRDLDSKNHTTIVINAAYELGEMKDTSAVKLLLTHILDPRTSTNLNYKGMCVCYGRLIALKKISGINTLINRFDVDTAAAHFYLDWAVKNHYLKDKSEIDLNYY